MQFPTPKGCAVACLYLELDSYTLDSKIKIPLELPQWDF